MPKVSVIIPTYNRANLLPRAINSVLNQTYRDFELIIIDDGSTDNTQEIVKEFQKKDDRIKYLWKRNSGCVASTLNFGIPHCKGLYITFCASDDQWDPTYLEKQISLFDNSKNVDVVSTNVLIVDSQGRKLTEISKPRTTNNDSLIEIGLRNNYLFGNMVIKKTVLNEVGLWDDNLKIREDFDLWMRIAKKNFNFRFIYEPLFIVTIHPNQISNSVDILERIKIENYLFKKHKALYDKYPKARSVYFRHLSTMYALLNNKSQALKNLFLAIKSAPFYLRNYIHLFLLLGSLRLFKLVFTLKRKLFPF
jgi:glycosyltransferase involved in cell wall biosynthesis